MDESRQKSHRLQVSLYPTPESVRGTARYGLTALLVIFSAVRASGESERSLSGLVHDRTSGSGVEGAIVSIDGTVWRTETDMSGRFVFRSIPTGRWRINVRRAGYENRSWEGIEVVEGFERVLHLPLEPAPLELPAQEVKASRSTQPGVHRIELTAARQLGIATLADALARVPGVRTYGSSESPGGTRVSVGGEPAERVAVLLDGVPLSGGPDGAVDLDAIPFTAIRAIEVHSGSQSASVGDAAVGGTVNLITGAAGSKDSARLASTLSYGDFDTYRGSGTWDGAAKGARFSIGLEKFGRSDVYSYPDGDSSVTRQGAGQDGLRLYGSFARPSGLSAIGFVYRAVNGVPGALEQSRLGAENEDLRSRVQFVCPWEPTQSLSASTAIWHEQAREQYLYRTHRPDSESTESIERFIGGRTEVSLHSAGFDGHWLAEVRHRRQEGINHYRPRSSFGAHDRTEFASRLSAGVSRPTRLGSFTPKLGAAIDVETDRRPIFSPRADLIWNHLTGFHASFGWGRSFRRPTLNSLFWKADARVEGNPDLRPERASEWDLGGGWNHRGIGMTMRYFERDVTDIIIWERDFSGKYRPQNLKRSRVLEREDHVSLEVSRSGRAVGLDYVHVFTDATDRSGEVNQEGKTLLFTPRHTHDLHLNGEFGRLSAQASGRWVSKRYTRRANTKSLPAYRAFDVGFNAKLRRGSPSLGVGIHGDNVTNERIELLERYPSLGRSWSAVIDVVF